jgi:hypothetical protein
MNLSTEAVIVGASNVAAVFVVSRFTNNPLLGAFIAGVALHLTYEWTGLNKEYCWERKQRWMRSQKKHLTKKRWTNSCSGGSLSDSEQLCSTDTTLAPSLTNNVLS